MSNSRLPVPWVDIINNLSFLEVVNLVNIGISSHYTRQQVLNNLLTHGQIVDGSRLRSQEYLNKINLWSENQEMIVSEEEKFKTMILNFTDRYLFHTWLQLKSQNFEVVKKMKILGTIFTDRLSWNENCDTLFRKVNAQMQLLRKVWSFGSHNRRWFTCGIFFVQVSLSSHVSCGGYDYLNK